MCNPAFVADWYMDRFKTLGNNAKIHDPESLAAEFNKTMRVNIKYHTSRRERNIVLQKLYGSFEEQHKKNPAFCEMVKCGYIFIWNYRKHILVNDFFLACCRGFLSWLQESHWLGCLPFV